MSTDTLTSAEAAALLGISPGALAAARHRGTSPTYTKVGHRTITYKRDDVERFIAARGVEHPSVEALADRLGALEKRVARIERGVKKS